MFNWNDLVFFLELARQGRLLPAARRLKVDHTTVSRRISELEKDLAVKLFVRRPDGFVLTEEGHKLLSVAERMEAQSNAVAETISLKSSELSGKVRLATMEGIAAYYLANRLTEFNRLYPRILVELVTERHLTNLSKREADISLSFEPPLGPRLDVKKIGSFGLGLYAAQSYLEKRGTPADVSELHGHDFVDYIPDLIAIPNVHWLFDIIQPEHVVFRSSSMAAQQNALAAGRGIGLLPYFSASIDDRLTRVLPQISAKRDIFISVHEDIQFMSRIRALTKFLADLIERDQAFLN